MAHHVLELDENNFIIGRIEKDGDIIRAIRLLLKRKAEVKKNGK